MLSGYLTVDNIYSSQSTAMRLLESLPDGSLVFHDFSSRSAPPYAILSHTWHEDNNQEVSYQDVLDGSGTEKIGYAKIRFCAERAALYGPRFFWTDTCCIDKSNTRELEDSINSMFQWYKNAATCYVYLTDVSMGDHEALGIRWRGYAWGGSNAIRYTYGGSDAEGHAWEKEFERSRWFTRGWTLQELLAPSSVEFYSREGIYIGTKPSLEHIISKVTSIPYDALRGCELSRFTVDERLAWACARTTRIEEDEVYSLLGLFGIEMPLKYGEGRDGALERLRRTINGFDSSGQSNGSPATRY